MREPSTFLDLNLTVLSNNSLDAVYGNNTAPYGPLIATPARSVRATHPADVVEVSGASTTFGASGAPVVVAAYDEHGQRAATDVTRDGARVELTCTTTAYVGGADDDGANDEGTLTRAVIAGDIVSVPMVDGAVSIADVSVVLRPKVNVTIGAALEFVTPEGVTRTLRDDVRVALRACVAGEEVYNLASCVACTDSYSFDALECYEARSRGRSS